MSNQSAKHLFLPDISLPDSLQQLQIPPSCLLLSSGGFDSLVTNLVLLHLEVDVFPIFVNYQQLALKEERNAFHQLMQELQTSRVYAIELSFREIESDSNVRHFMPPAKDIFYPARNLQLLLAAGQLAQSLNISTVVTGINREGEGFVDCRPDYLDRTQAFLRESLQFPLQIWSPFLHWSKRELMALFTSMCTQFAQKTLLSKIYSCHHPRQEDCVCVKCLEITEARSWIQP